MSNSNGIITPPVINPKDTKTFITASSHDIGGQVLEGVSGKVNKWSKIKPIPIMTDYVGNSLAGARIGQTVNGVVGGNKYTLRNDVSGTDSKSMYGYVGNVINDTTAKTITVCGLTLKYFAATAGETTGLRQCCEAMDSVANGDAGSSAYNWPYQWSSGWYRFTDFENYYKNARFPFFYSAPDEVAQGSSFVASVSNLNVTSTYSLSPAAFADGLVNWKFAVILKATPVNAQAAVQYVLITGDSVDSDSADISISETYANLSLYSSIKLYFVMTGNILSAPNVIPMPFGPGNGETPILSVNVKANTDSDILQYFDTSFQAFGYDISTRTKVVPFTEMAGWTSGGKVPATNDKLLLKIILTNHDTGSSAPASHILPITSMGFDAYRDGVRTGRYVCNGTDVIMYDSAGNALYDDGNTTTSNPTRIEVAKGASVTLYFCVGNIWGSSVPQSGTNVVSIDQFKILWLDTAYEGGAAEHGFISIFLNNPASSADSGKVGNVTLDPSVGSRLVTSYTSY